MFSFASADLEFMKPAELNKPYLVVQTCENATYVNITISNKDGLVRENQGMSLNGSGNFIYSLTNTQIGRHDVTGICDVNGIPKPFATYYEVTPSGLTGTLGFYFLIVILSVGVILLGFYVRDPTITVLGTLGLYFLAFYVLFYGIDTIKDPIYTWAFGLITLGSAAYISIKAAYEGYLS